MESACLTAGLNFGVPGLGCFYAGTKRTYFSFGLTVGTILAIVRTPFWSDISSILGGAIIALVFAVDRFQDPKKRDHAQRLSDFNPCISLRVVLGSYVFSSRQFPPLPVSRKEYANEYRSSCDIDGNSVGDHTFWLRAGS